MNKVQTHETICKELNALYARKNADYGDSFGKSYREYGLTMACIRLEDKLNRIKALRTKEAQVSDESILDTLMDLANYSIMTLVEMRVTDTGGDKPLPEFGDHSNECCTEHHSCPCNTCRRDITYGVDEICCVRHNRDCKHPGLPCPDYILDCDVEDDDEV